MTSRQIICFLTVSETLNFTETAEKLYASQSSVSRYILMLEEELGVKLFERGNNYVTLTQAGAIMAAAFKEMDEIFHRQHKIATYLANGISGKITLGFHSNMDISHFCLEYLDSFKKSYPYVVIDFICQSNMELNSLFSQNQVDIAITHDFNRPIGKSYLTREFYQTNMFLLYGKRHPNYGKPNLCLEDFTSSQFYCPEECESEEFNLMMDRLTSFYGVTPWQIHTTKNIETVLMNVRFGNGVSFMDHIVLEYIGEDMAVLPLDKSASLVNINITWDKKNPNPMIPLLVKCFLGKDGKETGTALLPPVI